MHFDINQAEALCAASRRAAIVLRAAQRAVLEGVRSQAPVAMLRRLDHSLREASAAASAAAAAYHLFLLENGKRAHETAKTITAGIGYVSL